MGDFTTLKVTTDQQVLRITIDQEKKLNALSTKTLAELRQAINIAYNEETVRAVLITGAGSKAFAAGADIKELESLSEVNARKFAENGQEVFELIENCEKPVIAAVNGFALGGGCELAMACHLRLASANAKFGLPELNLGIIPGYGGTQRLTRLAGRSKALEMILTGDMVAAEDALKIGLVNHVSETIEDLHAAVDDIIGKIMKKAPLAVGMAINCVNAVHSVDENGYQTEANSFANCVKTSDFKEGVSAFLAKKEPEFKGE